MNFENVSKEDFENLMNVVQSDNTEPDEVFIQKMMELKAQVRASTPPPAQVREDVTSKPTNIAPTIVEPPKRMNTPIKSNNPLDQLMQDNSNYYFIDKLPTQYVLYPEGTKLYGRPLTVLEVKKVSTINEYNSNYIINDILRKTIKGIDINDLYIADKIYLMFWLRANTYRDSRYVVDYKCEKCDFDGQVHVGVDSINIENLSEDFYPSKEYTTPDDHKFTFDFMKIGDELKIERFKDHSAKLIGGVDDDILNLSIMIKKVDGRDATTLEKYNWLVNMEPGIFSYILSTVGQYNVGIKPYINIECTGCGGETLMGISFRPEFFLPKYKFD